MVVQHNLTAMNANRYLGINNSKLSKSLEKLSSGYAINRAGDNAAGLAVSEKMRSQIAGMTQGVKNAQDGISMVQTFEGALTETHSILQRMKTLADQMGNDSYDDPVDRKAAQQEFLQLNDELNQIADTDFNGVVVLNGGKMADGLEQVDGKFDYSMKADQVAAANAKALADAQAAADKNIADAQKAYDAALNRYNTVTNRDQCVNGTAANWNSLDNSQYNKTAADKLFDQDLTSATVSADSTKGLTGKGVEELDITYQFVKKGDKNAAGTAVTEDTWEIVSASYEDENGKTVVIDKDTDATALSAIQAVIDKIETTANGGFIANSGTQPTSATSSNAAYGNVVMNSIPVESGDQVTLTYTHSASETHAPTNIGIDMNSLDNQVDDSVPTLTLDSKITDASMNEETAAALEKLDKADVEFAYSATGIKATISDEDLIITQDEKDLGKFTISYTNSKGEDVKLATINTTKPHDASKAELKESTMTGKTNVAATGTLAAGAGPEAGTKLRLVWDQKSAATGEWKILNADGTRGASATATPAIGGTTVTATVANLVNTGTQMDGDILEITVATAAGATSTTVGDVKLDAEYIASDAASMKVGTALNKDETVTLTWGEGGWLKSDGTAWADTDTVGGQAITIANVNALVTGEKAVGDKITLSGKNGEFIVTADYEKQGATLDTMKFGIALDNGNYDAKGANPTIKPSESPNVTNSVEIDKAYEETKAALAAAKAARPEKFEDLPEEYHVSKSDAFDNSEAIMTYKDNIILQVGARTKDAVNFTFKYDSDAIGDLAADLNCTATGLGTDKLSIATQKDANFAVDKIDQAINKVSLIRGTFGAIQNRLEHKIDNMNVSIENLTSAESAIRDTNMPQEMMNFTKQQILAQASQSMLAQANQLPQGVLSLLQ